MRLHDKRVLVTGAAGGIGKELVRLLLERGAHVILAGRDALALKRCAAMFGGDQQRMVVCAGDLTSAADRARLCELAASWRGGVDILINNAGANEFGLLADQAPDSVERMVSTNVLAPIELVRGLLAHLRSRPQAHIVNVGSVFGSIGYAGSAVYSATKFALRGFSEALRRECADSHVSVHYFAPRATATAFNSSLVDTMNAELGNALDDPAAVAEGILAALEAERPQAVFGWPERLFVRINAMWPRLVDRGLRKQLPIIERYAGEAAREHRVAAVINRRRVG